MSLIIWISSLEFIKSQLSQFCERQDQYFLKVLPENNYLIAVAWKGPLEGLNAPAYKLGKIQKWCWCRFVQIRKYWTEVIDEIKIAKIICINLHVQNFEIFCCHSYDILIYVVKKINASGLQKCSCENQPTMSSRIIVLNMCNKHNFIYAN